MNDVIEQKLKMLPDSPGVYVMLNADGHVIYVGKAKILKNRVRQYFHAGVKTDKVMAMVNNIADVYYIMTNSEIDALSLENNLIKKYKPKYNILLKDDKTYPYLKVNLKEPYPRFEITRRVRFDGSKYFGPFMGGVSVNEVLEMINQCFELRTCKQTIPNSKVKRECINYQIGRCSAPCTNRISVDDYHERVEKALDFLNGNDDTVENIIREKMLFFAENDPHEKAQIAAVDVLGQYMFEEVLEEPIPVSGKKLHEVLEKLIEHKNNAIRRAAVIAYAISETKRVNEIIRAYLAGSDPEELIAGLRAVRVSLNEDHAESVLELINNDDEDVAVEAIRAAGALRLREALPAVYELISRFDRISPALLYAAVNAAAEIGDESSLDVLETLGEAAVDMDEDITEMIDDCIDTLNMEVCMGLDDDEEDEKESRSSKRSKAMLNEAIEAAKDRCLSILEEKIPHDLEDDEAFDLYDEEEDEHDHGHDHDEHHHHHHHHHENPLEGLDLSRFRILDDLEAYESAAHHDADEEELWAEFENMAEEDLDAESLQDFINKLEAKKKKK